jgi:enoyl-CoA hydratase
MLARGFLTRVVADEALAEHTHATLLRMLALSPLAARMNKQTFRRQDWALAHMSQAQNARSNGANELPGADAYAYATHPEHREGVSAFLDKRPQVF